MNKNLFIIIGLLAVISIGGYFFMNQEVSQDDATKDQNTETEKVSEGTREEKKEIPKTSTPVSPAPQKSTPPPPPPTTTIIPPPPPAKSVPGSNVTVAYSNTGFYPETIEVNAGQVVAFINNGTLTMQIASSPHPTHTENAELNQNRSVGKNGTFITTLTQVGIWHYHNEGNTSKSGTIIVKP